MIKVRPQKPEICVSPSMLVPDMKPTIVFSTTLLVEPRELSLVTPQVHVLSFLSISARAGMHVELVHLVYTSICCESYQGSPSVSVYYSVRVYYHNQVVQYLILRR